MAQWSLYDSVRDPEPWRTLKRESIYEGERFETIEESVELPAGESATVEYVHEPDGAVVLPFTSSGEVVTIREWRHAVGRVVTGLPGGVIEPDETPEAAAERELREETGYVPARIEPLVTVETTNGLTDGIHHHFVAYGCSPTETPNQNSSGKLKVERRSFDELRDGVVSGEIRDAKTVTPVLYHAAENQESE